MSYSSTLKRLKLLHPKYIDLNLDRILTLLKRLGNPHKKLPPTFHIAGTNGKGSTVAFLRNVLELSGLKVHAYTSPHLIHFTERIRLCGQLISKKILEEVLLEVEDVNDGKEITFFEITTAAAFLVFSRIKADVLLLEVGLGGRLDATNVIEKPLASIITSISYDHENFLGNNLKQIASEKSGIIKKNIPVITQNQNKEVIEVFSRASEKMNSPLYIIGDNIRVNTKYKNLIKVKIDEKVFSFKKPRLLGDYQNLNAILAISSLIVCKNKIKNFCLQKSLNGISKTVWPARMQKLIKGPLIKIINKNFDKKIILDGSHNPRGIELLANDLKKYSDENWQIIFGSINTRNPSELFNFLKPITSLIVTLKIPGQENSYTALELRDKAEQLGINAVSANSLNHAINLVSKDSLPVCICGSLYLAGYFLKINKNRLN